MTFKGGKMELDTLNDSIEILKGEIEKSPKKLKYFKYENFLERFGMKNRRNFEVLDKIDLQLKQNQITCWRGRDEMGHLNEFNRGETITFRMVQSEYEDNKMIKYPNAGKIRVASGKSNVTLFKHQEDAIKNLNDKILKTNKNPFAGLLVLPTGGGKTLTAVHWLLKNYTDNNKKILWIAHRHELLEQAKNSFKVLAYSNILKNRTSFNYRIISGLHDKPVNIRPTDDILIASKDSINRGFNYLYENWIKDDNHEVFLVIDEAHHATAKTYRRLIENLNENVEEFRMMGLTATPFRTAESERGLLKKVFPDDIIYKTDLRTLINRGILSEPIFKEIGTDIDMTEILSESELDNINYFDIDSIGRATAKTIAENSKRNHCIVDHYIENKATYKKTLVFALNIDNAIALNSLFKSKGVKSEFVVSSIRDLITGVNISSKENKEKIERFRNGDLDVLINVNILTEGTDLPEVQSVFLARPTISSILMTQMIGRGLRGQNAGGTKNAYIVSFIDDWKDKVAWVNPETLLEGEEDFQDIANKKQSYFVKLVSLKLIEEFTDITDKAIDTDELESLEFIERIPVGLYSFSIFRSYNGEEIDKDCDVLVYNNIKQAYDEFINALPDFFKKNNISDNEELNENELDDLCKKVEDSFFYGTEKYPGYEPEDIKDILFYYAQKEDIPKFIELKDREKYDIKRIVDEILEKDLGEKAKTKMLNKYWNDNETEWKAFFGFNEKYFLNEIDLDLRKRLHPELYIQKTFPKDIPEERSYKKLSMPDLREHCPKYWRKLRDKVFEKFRDEDGYYHSAKGDFKSKNTQNFQIDHIKPISKGGLTVIDNLQLLTRQENASKGDKED